LYCFSNKSFPNILKIGTTVLNVNDHLDIVNSKNKNPYKLEIFIQIEDLSEICIYKKLLEYKYSDENELFKLELNKIKKFFAEELMCIENQRRKISHISKFIKLHVERSEEIKSYYDEPVILKSYDLYNVYNLWCNKLNITKKEKAEICEFIDLCENHTFLGKSNTYYEWECMKLK
jgi:hypothetical protein